MSIGSAARALLPSSGSVAAAPASAARRPTVGVRLADEGLLVSCSCSYHLAPQELLEAIQTAARHTGRFVQVLESGGQSADHPVHPAIPETRYLKAFFCRVTRAVG